MNFYILSLYNMKVTYATPEDIKQIQDRLVSKPEWIELVGYTWFEKFDKTNSYRSPIIVAKDGNDVLWFIELDYDSIKIECLLESLYVFPEHRKKWVARLLYEFAINDIKEKSYSIVRVNVFDNNEIMKMFITKLWFKNIWYRDFAHKRYWERWKLNFYRKVLD